MKKTIFAILVLTGILLLATTALGVTVQSQIKSNSPLGLQNHKMVSVLLLNQEPNPASAGDTVELRFRIENTGGLTADKVTLQIVNNYPFTVIDGDATQEVGPLYPYQTDKNYIFFTYTLLVDKDAPSGERLLQLKYSYEDEVWVVKTLAINVVNKDFAQIIHVDKAKLEPGVETNLTFTVNNLGNAPLKNLVFSWKQPSGVILPVYSDDSKYLKYLDIGKSATLSYTVVADVNAVAGLYPLDLTLQFESLSNSTLSTIQTTSGVLVGGGTDFDVSFSESSAGLTSLSVANTGSNPAQSVSVVIPNQPGYTITGSNSAIIGNLDKGDYTIVSFQIAQSNMTAARNATARTGNFSGQRNFTGQRPGNFTSAAANGMLLVDIDYTDTTGVRHTVEKTVQMQLTRGGTGFSRTTTTTSSSFFTSTPFYAILIIVVIIVGWIVYKKVKKITKTEAPKK